MWFKAINHLKCVSPVFRLVTTKTVNSFIFVTDFIVTGGLVRKPVDPLRVSQAGLS